MDQELYIHYPKTLKQDYGKEYSSDFFVHFNLISPKYKWWCYLRIAAYLTIYSPDDRQDDEAPAFEFSCLWKEEFRFRSVLSAALRFSFFGNKFERTLDNKWSRAFNCGAMFHSAVGCQISVKCGISKLEEAEQEHNSTENKEPWENTMFSG